MSRFDTRLPELLRLAEAGCIDARVCDRRSGHGVLHRRLLLRDPARGIRRLAHGQVQAARSLGLSGLQVQRHVVLPQIFGFLAPATTSLTIMMFKDSSIFSVMSLTELTYQSNLLTADTFAYVEVLGTTALIYWLCSVLLDVAGQWSERYATRYRRV